MNELRSILHTDCLTVNGHTIGENIADAKPADGEIIRPITNPFEREGGIAVLYGNLAPKGSVVKCSAIPEDQWIFEGPAMNPERLSYIDDLFNGRVETIVSNSFEAAVWAKKADLLISCVLIPGAMAPKVIKEYMVKEMKKGSVIVDVAIDQGGGVETIDHVTTHTDPIYIKYGVIHYAVANIPGAVPMSAKNKLIIIRSDRNIF